jgi:hypothetical protein
LLSACYDREKQRTRQCSGEAATLRSRVPPENSQRVDTARLRHMNMRVWNQCCEGLLSVQIRDCTSYCNSRKRRHHARQAGASVRDTLLGLSLVHWSGPEYPCATGFSASAVSTTSTTPLTAGDRGVERSSFAGLSVFYMWLSRVPAVDIIMVAT